jgi:hypothetical protein
MILDDADLNGTLLAASSAHDPDPTVQVLVIRYLLERGTSVNDTASWASLHGNAQTGRI